MGYFIGAAILAIIGVILWVLKSKRAGKSALLELMDTSRISDVKENHKEMVSSMGSGNFTFFVEVKGKSFAETPLKSEISEEEVVYFKSTVEHQYEKLESKKDADGNVKKEWVKHTDIVSENERWAAGFGVKDDTGFIAINPKKSKLDTEKLHSNFEKGDPNQNEQSNGLNIKFKGLSFGIGGKSMNNGLRTIGYHYEEVGIRMNQPLYVVGEANDRDGQLIISKPTNKKNPFIISSKTKDELLGGLGSAVKGFMYGAIGAWAIAVVLLVIGIMK